MEINALGLKFVLYSNIYAEIHLIYLTAVTDKQRRKMFVFGPPPYKKQFVRLTVPTGLCANRVNCEQICPQAEIHTQGHTKPDRNMMTSRTATEKRCRDSDTEEGKREKSKATGRGKMVNVKQAGK